MTPLLHSGRRQRDYNTFVYSSLCDHESFYLDFEFIITRSTAVITVIKECFCVQAECLFLSVNFSVNMERCVQKDINSVFSFPRRHLVCLMWCLRISTMEWCQWCWLKYTARCKNVRLESQSKWERGTDSREIRTERHMMKREGHKSD